MHSQGWEAVLEQEGKQDFFFKSAKAIYHNILHVVKVIS